MIKVKIQRWFPLLSVTGLRYSVLYADREVSLSGCCMHSEDEARQWAKDRGYEVVRTVS